MAHFVDNLTKQKPFIRDFTVLEVGAGRGDMRHALAPFNYRPSDLNSPALPVRMEGLVFANEFFDALPVHLLVKSDRGWRELFIKSDDDGFAFSEETLVDDELQSYTDLYASSAQIGDQIEVCTDLKNWCARLAGLLTQGDLLVIDYGYDPHELRRLPEGTLLSYQAHVTSGNVLDSPGERDITAHVNFAWLRNAAEHAGFRFHSSLSLGQWLLSVWDEEELERRWLLADQRWKLQWKHLLFGLGEVFRVVRFQK
jgi:SAM-dependent MidA family methyltransferase